MSKFKGVFKALFLCFSFAVCFFLVGFLYLNSHIANPTDNNASKVPYYSSIPEGAGLVFQIGEIKTLVSLDFEREEVALMFLEDEFEDNAYGYAIDFKVKGEKALFAGIVDNVGGIDLVVNGELLNCTGNQVLDYLAADDGNEKLREVIVKIFEKISQNGISREDLVYVINNSQTNLTISKCYKWVDYIKNTCKYVRFVN